MLRSASLLLSLLVAVAVAVGLHQHCPKCDPELCPKSAAACPQGLVPDPCGCCGRGVCGLAEGDKCWNASLASVLPAGYSKYGACGSNLQCLLRQDLTSRDQPEALCYCKDLQAACGSDNRTYSSVCELNREAARDDFQSLRLQHWGPCLSVPWIISPPQTVSASLHQGMTLDCEVKGFPIPSVHWEFDGDDGTNRLLPSDDQLVAIQVRGGPEPLMATSWVQIVDLRRSDIGRYTCVAVNSEGEARASARVGLRR